MKNRLTWMLAAFATLAAGALPAAELDPRLAPLQPLVGKTWRGEMSPPGAARPVVDVHRFELALNGRAVKSRHTKDGQWVDGREVYYVEDPKAVVRFKD